MFCVRTFLLFVRLNLFLGILHFVHQISARVFLIHLFFSAGFFTVLTNMIKRARPEPSLQFLATFIWHSFIFKILPLGFTQCFLIDKVNYKYIMTRKLKENPEGL